MDVLEDNGYRARSIPVICNLDFDYRAFATASPISEVDTLEVPSV